jgi:replication factor C subunit 1
MSVYLSSPEKTGLSPAVAKDKTAYAANEKRSVRKNQDYALWTVKWAPKSSKELVGNKTAIETLAKWLNQW